MSTVPPMVSLALVKDWLAIGVDAPDTRFDTQLTIMINAASAKIAQYCDTDFQQHTVVGEIVDGGRSDVIIPKILPVISVQALAVGIDNQLANGLPMDPTDYQIEPWGISLKFLNTPQGRAQVSISYTGGYVAVPDDVVQAALLTVEAFYLRKAGKRIGVSSRTKAVGSGTSEQEQYMNAWDMDSGLPKEAVALLQSHKNFEWPANQSMATRGY